MPVPKELNSRPSPLLRLRVVDRLVDHPGLVSQLDPATGANRFLRHEPAIYRPFTRVAKPVARAHVIGNGELNETVGSLDLRQLREGFLLRSGQTLDHRSGVCECVRVKAGWGLIRGGHRFDRSRGRTGGLILIHGDCVSIGCLAMTDAGIEEIYTLADAAHRAGQRSFAVDIFPFRMTAENLKRHGTSKWKGFWQNLRQGHDAFEARRVPPKVTSRDGRYVFSRD